MHKSQEHGTLYVYCTYRTSQKLVIKDYITTTWTQVFGWIGGDQKIVLNEEENWLAVLQIKDF